MSYFVLDKAGLWRLLPAQRRDIQQIVSDLIVELNMLLTRDGEGRLESSAGDSESALNGDPAIAVTESPQDAVSHKPHIDIGAPDLVAVGD